MKYQYKNCYNSNAFRKGMNPFLLPTSYGYLGGKTGLFRKRRKLNVNSGSMGLEFLSHKKLLVMKLQHHHRCRVAVALYLEGAGYLHYITTEQSQC